MEESGSRKSILLAISDRLLGERFRTDLTAAGYAVSEAFDGEEALEHAQASAPDLLILDAKLQKRDGFAVLEALRDEPAFEQVPALMVIDMDSTADRNRAVSLSAAGVIIKSGPSVNEIARLAAEALGGEAVRKPLSGSSTPHDAEALSGDAPEPGRADDGDTLLGDATPDEAASDSNSSSEPKP